MSDQNKKTLRQFQCRDYLWEIFEQMSGELECSVDYLVNEAMRQYARSRNYGGTRAPTPEPASRTMRPEASSPRARPPSQPAIPSAPPPPSRSSFPQSNAAAGASPPFAPPPPPPRAPSPYGSVSASSEFTGQHHPSHPQPSAPYPAPPARPTPAPASSYPPPTARPRGSASWSGGFVAPAPPPLPSSAPPLASGPRNDALPSLFVIFNGQKFPVNKEEFIIGRGTKSADLAIKDGNISRRHAAVIFQNGAFYMKDLGSTNGVEYQGRRVDGRRIEEGDVYQLCDYELRFTYR